MSNVSLAKKIYLIHATIKRYPTVSCVYWNGTTSHELIPWTWL